MWRYRTDEGRDVDESELMALSWTLSADLGIGGCRSSVLKVETILWESTKSGSRLTPPSSSRNRFEDSSVRADVIPS